MDLTLQGLQTNFCKFMSFVATRSDEAGHKYARDIPCRNKSGCWIMEATTGNTYLSSGLQFGMENKQRRMHLLSLKMHLQHEEMSLLDFLQPITRSKQLLTTLR